MSKETVADQDPCSEVNESTVVHDASSIQEAFSEHSSGDPPIEAQSGMTNVPIQVHLASPSSEMRDQPVQESRETLPQPTQTPKQENLMAESKRPTLSLSLSPPKELVKCPPRTQSASSQAMSPHRSPPMSTRVGPTPRGVDPNLSLSQPDNCEQKPAPKSVQVEDVSHKEPAAEKRARYPRRIRRRPDKFNDDFLCKLEEGNYSVSTLANNQTDTLLESIEHLKFTDLIDNSNETIEKQVEAETDAVAGNKNLGRRGVEPVAIKVYHWFDDYENLNVKEALTLPK